MATPKAAPSIPFHPTHRLTAKLKSGTIEADVMAILDATGETPLTRLYDGAQAQHGGTPNWRVVGEMPVSEMVTHVGGDTGPEIQRDRKPVASAVLRRLGDIVCFELGADGYKARTLTSWGAAYAASRAPAKADALAELAVVAVDQAATKASSKRQAIPVVSNAALEAARKADAIATKAHADVVVNNADGSTPDATPTKRPRVVGGRKPKAEKKAKGAHREGSVMGMTIAELQAEFTRLTGVNAPSNSIHYMRKMVLGARRGNPRVLTRRTGRAPTLTVTAEEAFAWVDSKTGRAALDEKLRELAAKHVVATEPTKAA